MVLMYPQSVCVSLRWSRRNANGNLVFSTNGTGIDFSASAGGGASSSLLDDYEEGTWTPDLIGSTSGEATV
jgi:hypothetical protein